MKFSKVKLEGGGLHGLTANYTLLEERDNYQFENEFVRKRKAPVPQDLKTQFAKLKSFLMDICFLTDNAEDDVEITGVSSNADSQFLIMGKVRANGVDNAFFAINTPLIKSEQNYRGFNDVIEIVKEIYKQSKVYFKDKLIAPARQIALDLFKEDSEKVIASMNKDLPEGEAPMLVNEDTIANMDEDQIKLIIAGLERKGCMVMTRDDHETTTEATAAATDEPERTRMAIAH